VVGRQRLVEGNAALAASESAANIVGPSLGGVLVQLIGAPVAILADAISFLVSAGSLAGIRASGTPAGQRAARQRLTHEIGTGLRYVLSHPLPRTVAVAGTLGNLVLGGYQAVIFVFLARQVGLSPALIGGLLALSSIGGLLGALAASPLTKRVGNARVMLAAPTVMATFGLLIPLTGKGTAIAWYVAGALPLSLGIAAFNVCIRSAMQVAAPDSMLGRVTATSRLLGRAAMPAGALGAGALATAITPRATLVILMVLLALVPTWLLLSPIGRVRDVAQLAPPAIPPIHEAVRQFSTPSGQDLPGILPTYQLLDWCSCDIRTCRIPRLC
jgi:predicted MFS family arabinose efflux permease